MSLTLVLDSAFIVLTLGGRSFTLTAPEASLSTERDDDPADANPSVQRTRNIHWKYHEAYDRAIELPLGSVAGLIQEVQGLLPVPLLPQPPDTPEVPLVKQWQDLAGKLANIPVLSNAATNVGDTITHGSVRITDLALKLDLVTTKTRANGSVNTVIEGSGAFTIGLAFVPSTAQPIRLFALRITAFGAVLTAKLTNLKFSPGTNGDSGALTF